MKQRRLHLGFDHRTPSEITPPDVYHSRREWLERFAWGGVVAATGGWGTVQAQNTPAGRLAPLPGRKSTVPGADTVEKAAPYNEATAYNNFYEFGLDKAEPAKLSGRFKSSPWAVKVEGLVNKPQTLALEDLLKLAPMEERTYRLRCVEGWSMVIPWVGYSLSALVRKVEPLGSAKYVEFVTQADKDTMPGLRSSVLAWPYVEGLRLDEAMHPLTLLAFGMYGQVLPNQNGAPLRLVVPWKYGFKSGKSLVAIRFTDKQPATAWSVAAPQEYGFYANVNPEVPHPRWSQASERRLGEGGGLFAPRRKTLLFNGYEPQVGQLYAGMDLRKFY